MGGWLEVAWAGEQRQVIQAGTTEEEMCTEFRGQGLDYCGQEAPIEKY